MSPKKYKLSFTAASLSISQSITIATEYLQCEDWDETKRVITEGNLLQSRVRSSSLRTYRELAQRLQLLTKDQLEILVDGAIQEQKHLLWYAICKRYTFIFEFAREVMRDKFLAMDYELTELDYAAFFDKKADWHPELETLKPSTKGKIKQVVFRMLREAGLVSEDNRIRRTVLSERVVQVLQNDKPESFEIFPVLLADLESSSP